MRRLCLTSSVITAAAEITLLFAGASVHGSPLKGSFESFDGGTVGVAKNYTAIAADDGETLFVRIRLLCGDASPAH